MVRSSVLFLLMWSAWAGAACRYSGNQFEVIYGGVPYRKTVASNYALASLWCGSRFAALYDGDDLVVFDGDQRKFEWRAAANGYSYARLSGSDGLVVFYDGEQFLTYDAKGFHDTRDKVIATPYAQVTAGPNHGFLYDGGSLYIYEPTGRFVQERAVFRQADVRLQAGRRLSVLYDTADLIIHDGAKNSVFRQPAKFTRFSSLAIAQNEVLFYDGEKVHGFCAGNRTFAGAPVGFDPFTSARVEKATGWLALLSRGKLYRLNPNRCEFEVRP